jgi:hypothetical protein
VYDRQVLITQGINNKGLNFTDSEWYRHTSDGPAAACQQLDGLLGRVRCRLLVRRRITHEPHCHRCDTYCLAHLDF